MRVIVARKRLRMERPVSYRGGNRHIAGLDDEAQSFADGGIRHRDAKRADRRRDAREADRAVVLEDAPVEHGDAPFSGDRMVRKHRRGRARRLAAPARDQRHLIGEAEHFIERVAE